jgi:hypothetical protein
MSDAAAWQADLPAAATAYLSGLLACESTIPASARPMTLTAGPVPPAPPSSAERLATAAQGKTGLVQVSLETHDHPLWMRAGTPDAATALASLVPGLKIPFQPRRILEIGAGAGYRSVALAQAYPDAEILTTEPDHAFQRVALLNTLPYRNIIAAFLTVSTDNARYAFTGRSGEAGRLALARDDTGTLTAQPLKNFLYGRGWTVFDTVIVTPDAASDHLLRAPWPASVRLIAVENGGAPLHSATAERFPDDKFLTTFEGNYVLLHRRAVDPTLPPPRPIPVFNPEGPPQSLTLTNTQTNPPSFFPLGAYGFRLHPNASEAQAIRLTLSHTCRNFAELHLSLRLVLPISKPVRFTLRITTPTGEDILAAAEILKGGETRAVILPLAVHDGPCEVMFSTEMAEFGDSNAGAWAEILSAAFV